MAQPKYIVVEIQDAKKFFDERKQKLFGSLLQELSDGRKAEGRKALKEYLVVDMEEPYAKLVQEVIDDNEELKQAEMDV